MWILLGIGVVLLVIAGFLFWSGRLTQQLVNLMGIAVPTKAAAVADAFPGELVSLTGTARAERQLLSEHSQVPCVYYSSSVVREYERLEHTRATRNRPGRTNRVRSSETISSNTISVPFFLEDETGRARVTPDGAEFDARQILNRYEPAEESGLFGIGSISVSFGNGNRTLGYRYTESVIPVDEPVYVLGVVDENGQITRPPATREKAGLIVSYRDETSLRDDWRASAQWQAYGSLGSGAVGAVLLLIAAAMAVL